MSEESKHWWFDLATQYYVAARFSAFAGLLPVYGNLFHRAIEMFLKGYLSSQLTLAELKNFHHNLQRIWNRFKQEVADQHWVASMMSYANCTNLKTSDTQTK